MAIGSVHIKLDEDWLALVAYRLALQCIVELAEERPWSVDDQGGALQRSPRYRGFHGNR